ncbi:MAG: serine protease, partial [Burkholderiales bacterium]|nr:serine protease [Burkholderiales bacterium]
MRPFLLWLALAGATLAATLAATRAAAQPGPPATPPSATAEAIYRDAKPRLLQIRTLLNAASQKSSTGSGFLISA